MRGFAALLIGSLFATPVFAWDIAPGREFPTEVAFTQFLMLELDCDGGQPVPVEPGIGIPWAGHDYRQLADGSWLASGTMLCHDPVGDGRKAKLNLYHWTVGFQRGEEGRITTNGRNSRRYQGYDYRTLDRVRDSAQGL